MVAKSNRRAFLRDCRLALANLAAALPDRLPDKDREALAGDHLARLLFLRIAGDGLTETPDVDPAHALHRLLPRPELSDKTPVVDITDPSPAAVTVAQRLLERYQFTASEGENTTVSAPLCPEILGDLVERLATNRLTRGAYYTPPAVANYTTRETLVAWLGGFRSFVFDCDTSDLSLDDKSELSLRLKQLTVLDPACGSGAFLIGMHRLLSELAATLRIEGYPSESALYGADIDPRAVGIARLRLWLATATKGRAAHIDRLLSQITVADSLADPTVPPRPRQFDLILTNPPYGVKVPISVRNLLFDPRRDGLQSRDAYGLFMAKTPALLADSGVAGLIVADTWRTIKSHLPLRRRLLTQTQLLHIIGLPGRTFDATVGAEIIIFRNTPPDPRLPLRTAESTNADTYTYPQSLCSEHPRAPLFIASPGLFRLMTSQTLVPLGNLAEIRHGLTTGNTRRFICKRTGAPGPYPEADPNCVIACENLSELLSERERQHGFDPARFGGRYLIPYDKGGPSRSANGWLPCYHVPTDYYIDWRADSVAAMKQLPGFRHDGRAFYFRPGITFSHTGHYAPTFRFGSGTIFDTAGSTLFPHSHDLRLLLALLNSKTVRYLFKNYINHSVNTSENPLKEIPLPLPNPPAQRVLVGLVDEIVRKQRNDRFYPFHLHEQPRIDRIGYELYALTDSDIAEVERWFRRRYPRLSENQT